MRGVGDQVRAHLVGDLAEERVVDVAGVGDGTADDRLGAARVREGADLVVVGAPSVHEALRMQPPRRHVFRGGREVARATLTQELVT